MHLLIVIVAAILIAAYFLQTPGALRNFVIGFSIPIILLVLLALVGMANN